MKLLKLFDRGTTDERPSAPDGVPDVLPGRDYSREFADLARRLDEQARRLDKLEVVSKGIDTEWSEWFDKFRRLYARIAKRQERDEAAETNTQQPTEPERSSIRPQPVNGGPIPTRRNY